MALASFAFQFRLVSIVFLGWLAWVVARRPYQETPSRLLAAFLAVVASGFALEYLWYANLGERATGGYGPPARTLQNLLGAIDPAILLAFSLSFPRPQPALRSPWLWVPYGAFTLYFVLLALEPVLAPAAGFSAAWKAEAAVLAFVHVNVTYLACFLLLSSAYAAQPRRFLSRQMLFLALGVGFAAFSRSSALFFRGGPEWAVQPYVRQMTFGFLLAAVLLGACWAFLAVRAPAARDRIRRLVATLLALVAIFYLVWGGLWVLDQALGWEYALYQNYFNLRWVFFALIVGYGVLRYQLFDFELQAQRAVRILASVPIATVLSMFVGDVAFSRGWTILEARLLAFAVAVGGALLLYVVTRKPISTLIADTPPQMDRRRLEIYEATLEYALHEREWSGEQRRFFETLREVFEVSAQEHDEVVARLRRARSDQP